VSGSTQCPHPELDFDLNVASFGDTNIRYLEVLGRCKTCEQRITFRGPVGMSPLHPAMALDGSELRAPFMIGTEAYDGKASGFSIEVST
jgi:hypothetical protein